MKIIKSKEDIQDGMYCRATEENFNALKELGFKSICHSDWKGLRTDLSFTDTDILKIHLNTQTFGWYSHNAYKGEEISFNLEYASDMNLDLESLGFLTPEMFKVQILKIYKSDETTEYIGVVNENIPAKWNSEGICTNLSSEFNLYREYKQRIYTKLNSPRFFPKQKFKVSWTEKMSLGLEQSGWKLATNEEINNFKN